MPEGADRPRRRLSKEGRRERILAAALEVFAERGYAETAMEHVSQGAGVTRSVLYDHFSSKKELYVSLLRRQRDEVMSHVAVAAEGEGSAEALFRRAIESFFAFVRDHPVTWRMLFHDYVGDPEVMAAHTEAQAEASLMMSQRLLGGSGAFLGMKSLSAEQREIVAHLCGAGLKAVARWWRDQPGVPLELVVETAHSTLWKGFTAFASNRPSRKSGGRGLGGRSRREFG
jgi:AcrR family transcriptional regulator